MEAKTLQKRDPAVGNGEPLPLESLPEAGAYAAFLPRSLGGSGRCTINYADSGCGFVSGLLENGLAKQCLNNDCGTHQITVIGRNGAGDVISRDTINVREGDSGWNGELDGTYGVYDQKYWGSSDGKYFFSKLAKYGARPNEFYHLVSPGLPQNSSNGTSLRAKTPYVDQKVLNSCTEDYFGVTLNAFDESRAGHAGSFTGTGPSYLPNNPNGSGGTATFKITNSLDYSNAQLTAYNKKLRIPGEPTSGPIIGLAVRGAPLRNYTGSDNGRMQLLMTQIHELGHSLDDITQIGYDIPENHSGKEDLGGKILEDCVRKRGGFKYR